MKKKCYLFVITYLILASCQGKEQTTIQETKFVESVNMVKTDTVSKVKKDVVNSCDAIVGKWNFKANDDSHSYAITVESTNGKYYVTYCFVQGQNGDYIDCPEDKATCFCENNSLTVELQSDFEDNPIKVNLSIVNKNTLKFKTLSNPGTSFFETEMIFLRRR